jgi:hypothetical protein
MSEAEQEAAGLGHHVHTFHDDSGGVRVANALGSKTAEEHAEHTERKKHLAGPPLPKVPALPRGGALPSRIRSRRSCVPHGRGARAAPLAGPMRAPRTPGRR